MNQLLDEAPVVTEAPADELKCTAKKHLGRMTLRGFEPIECGIKAVALFHSMCGGPDQDVYICQPLVEVFTRADADARCAICDRLLSEDWMVTPL